MEVRCRFPTRTGPCRNLVVEQSDRCHLHADKDAVAAATRMATAVRSHTPMSDAQIGAVVGVMNRHGVRYVIVGGVASQLHGAPVERTYDIDVVPDRAVRNLDALGRALDDLHARLWVGPNEPQGLQMKFDSTSLGAIQGFLNLVTDHGPLDITYVPDGTEGYSDLSRSVVAVRVGEVDAPVAALEDVIRSKEAAGRTKDLDVLPRLQRFLKARRNM